MQSLAFRSLDPMTQEEFARWVETLPWTDLHHYELLDGFVVRVPSPGWPNSGIAVQVMTRLHDFVEGQVRWSRPRVEPGLRSPDW